MKNAQSCLLNINKEVDEKVLKLVQELTQTEKEIEALRKKIDSLKLRLSPMKRAIFYASPTERRFRINEDVCCICPEYEGQPVEEWTIVFLSIPREQVARYRSIARTPQWEHWIKKGKMIER